jgi:hypothetical protein
MVWTTSSLISKYPYYYTSCPKGWQYESDNYGSALWHDECNLNEATNIADVPAVEETLVGARWQPTFAHETDVDTIEVHSIIKVTCVGCGAYFLYAYSLGYSFPAEPDPECCDIFDPWLLWRHRTKTP